ncbi:hypothetical protein [Microtetraspora glauca]|uniref:Uncharacterized protein n=1 Tax=Microtetraspora glauca TaxID=1996 RepID=A0ABV3GT57_MICGL
MSKTAVHDILNGLRLTPLRWETVSSLVHACRKALEQTGIDPDEALGTVADWHQRYCSYLHNGAPQQEAAEAGDLPTGAISPVLTPDTRVQDIESRTRVTTAEAGSGVSRSHSPDRSRMLMWFGPRGAELLDWAGERQALAAFELGVLLLNKGSLAEGGEFLRQAAQLDPRLTLKVNLRQGAHLYGKIPKDICRRVAVGYSWRGLEVNARQWRHYAQDLDGIPVVGVLSPVGRHAVADDVLELNPTRHAPLDPNEVQQIDIAYCEVYTSLPEPVLTKHQVDVLNSLLEQEREGASSIERGHLMIPPPMDLSEFSRDLVL